MFYLPFLPPAYSCELVTMGEERGSTVIFGNIFTRTDVILNVLLTRHSFFKSVMCTSRIYITAVVNTRFTARNKIEQAQAVGI